MSESFNNFCEQLYVQCTYKVDFIHENVTSTIYTQEVGKKASQVI